MNERMNADLPCVPTFWQSVAINLMYWLAKKADIKLETRTGADLIKIAEDGNTRILSYGEAAGIIRAQGDQLFEQAAQIRRLELALNKLGKEDD
jgi:hypothetical protein